MPGSAQTTISLTDVELRLVNGALNEILNGAYAIPDWEFSTLLGAERSEAEALLARIRTLFNRS